MKKNKAIEGYRGLMCLWVILFHYTVRYEQIFNQSLDLPVTFPNGGICGVAAFLVISGFFIANSLESLSNGNISNKLEWIKKKLIRLYPAYWCATTLTFISLTLFPLENIDVNWKAYLVNMVFIYHPGVQYVEGAHWYLSALFIGYVFFAATSFINKKDLPVVMFAISCLCVAINLYCKNEIFQHSTIINKLQHFLYLKYIPLMILGYYLFLYYKERNTTIIAYLIMSAFMALVINANVIVIMAIVLAITALLLLEHNYWCNWIFNNTIMQIMGKVSFPWYLIHQRIGYQIINNIDTQSSMGEGIAVIIALVVTFILAYYITTIIEPLIVKRINHQDIKRAK